MTEFKKLLNRPKKPKMQLIGQDGNIFAIMGRASRLLKNSGQGDKAKEMRDRVMSCDSYSESTQHRFRVCGNRTVAQPHAQA